MIYNIVYKDHTRRTVEADYCTYNPTGNYFLFAKNRKGVYYVDRKDMECIYIDKEVWNSMRNPERIDKVLQVFSDAWHTVPDWRLGQLLCNLQSAAGDDLFYMEDDKFIELLEEYFNIEHK